MRYRLRKTEHWRPDYDDRIFVVEEYCCDKMKEADDNGWLRYWFETHDIGLAHQTDYDASETVRINYCPWCGLPLYRLYTEEIEGK